MEGIPAEVLREKGHEVKEPTPFAVTCVYIYIYIYTHVLLLVLILVAGLLLVLLLLLLCVLGPRADI